MVDNEAGMARARILGRNAIIPNVALPRGRGVGPDRGVEENMGLGGGARFQLQQRQARLAVPLGLRDTHMNPLNRDMVGPMPGEVNPVSRIDRMNISSGGRIGRAAQAANAQFGEWRRAENLRLRGRGGDLRDSGNGSIPGVKIEAKEKGVEDVLTEAKAQTKELREINVAMQGMKTRPLFAMVAPA